MDFVLVDCNNFNNFNNSKMIKDCADKCTYELYKNMYELTKFCLNENKELKCELEILNLKEKLYYLLKNNLISIIIDQYALVNSKSIVTNTENIENDIRKEINKYSQDIKLNLIMYPLKNTDKIYYIIENKYDEIKTDKSEINNDLQENEENNDNDDSQENEENIDSQENEENNDSQENEENIDNDDSQENEENIVNDDEENIDNTDEKNQETLDNNINKKELQDSMIFIFTSTLLSSFIWSHIGLLTTGTLEGMIIGNSIGIIKGFIIGTALELSI